jgi:hypothetical protein
LNRIIFSIGMPPLLFIHRGICFFACIRLQVAKSLRGGVHNFADGTFVRNNRTLFPRDS